MASNAVSYQGLAVTLDSGQTSNSICLAIKFSAHKSYIVDISAQDSVRDLKFIVAQKAGISPYDIHLVFAGQQLQDNDLLQTLGIGSHTTLHAFCWSSRNAAQTNANQTARDYGSSVDDASYDQVRDSFVIRQSEGLNLNPSGQRSNPADIESAGRDTRQHSPSQFNRNSRPQGYHRFFVYCKLCDSIRPAKLRLMCRECGNGAFLVDRGPANWNDISSSTTITGTCKAEKCGCKQPRFYLRCLEPHEGDSEGTVVVLKHVNTNRRMVECIACGDVVSHVLIFPCEVGHVTCLECFRQYCSVCLSERRFTEHETHGYTLPCPAGCPDSYIEETHHFLLMGKEKYERYKNFGAEEFVLQNGGMLCPAPGCGMGLFPEDDTRLIKCEECQFESCKDCRRAYHTGSCRDIDSMALDRSTHHQEMGITEEMAQRARWEVESLSLIEETTKCCPNCQIKTERNGGCMHMVCSRCECEWCWICIKPWTRSCMAEHWFG